jgi:hypothetical protein
MLHHLGPEAGARVAHCHGHAAGRRHPPVREPLAFGLVAGRDADRQRAAFRHGLQCVRAQVHDGLEQLRGVAADAQRQHVHVPLQPDPPEGHDAVHHRAAAWAAISA